MDAAVAQGVNHARDALLTLMAGREGHFALESGHHGDLWLDLDALFARPARLLPFVDDLASRLTGHGVEVVCGPLVGGAFVAQLIASRLEVEFCYTERTARPRHDALYSAEYRLAGRPALTGRRIVVVDDVINAGSAVRATLTELRTAGARPVVLGALLVLGARAEGLAADQAIPLEVVAALDTAIWTPGDCPLCAAAVPLQDLG